MKTNFRTSSLFIGLEFTALMTRWLLWRSTISNRTTLGWTGRSNTSPLLNGQTKRLALGASYGA